MNVTRALAILALVSAGPASGQTQLFVNEFLAENLTGITDEMGEPEDWIEVVNLEAVPVDMGGMYLTNDAAVPDKWQIPAGTTIGANDVLLFWADKELTEGPTHVDFRLRPTGGTVQLVDTDGTTVIDGFDYGSQEVDVSTGRLYDGFDFWVTLIDPSPGVRNLPSPQGGTRRYDAVNPHIHHIAHSVGGTPALGDTITLIVRNGPPGTEIRWYLSATPVYVPFPSGLSVLLVNFDYPSVGLTTDLLGGLDLDLPVPNNPNLIGVTLFSQFFDIIGYAKGSNAVEFTIDG